MIRQYHRFVNRRRWLIALSVGVACLYVMISWHLNARAQRDQELERFKRAHVLLRTLLEQRATAREQAAGPPSVNFREYRDFVVSRMKDATQGKIADELDDALPGVLKGEDYTVLSGDESQGARLLIRSSHAYGGSDGMQFGLTTQGELIILKSTWDDIDDRDKTGYADWRATHRGQKR